MSSPYPEPTPLVPRRPVAGPSQSPRPTRQPPQPTIDPRLGDQRIGDAERSRACEELSAHYAAGRLSDDELDERVTGAMSARTWADLRPLLGDLPSTAPPVAQGQGQGQGQGPVPAQPVGPRVTPWSAADVLALLTLIGTVGIAVLGALGVLLAGNSAYIALCTLTAITAGLGGMALTQLLHRARRSIVERAAIQAQLNRSSGPDEAR